MASVAPNVAVFREQPKIQRLTPPISFSPTGLHDPIAQHMRPQACAQAFSSPLHNKVSTATPNNIVYRNSALLPQQYNSPEATCGRRQVGPVLPSALVPEVGIRGSIEAQAGPLGLSPNRPACAYPDAADPVGIRVQQEWEEVSTVADGILRGPVDHVLRDPERARCRLCGQALTGDLAADQCIACNYRLVTAMDFAWEVCERFCHQKAELHKQALSKRRHLEDVRGLATQLRSEMPSQVHGYVMRTINEPREKLQMLRQQLEDLNAIDGLGLGWSEGKREEAAEIAAAEALRIQDPDELWHRFCESVDRRVARLAVQGGGSPPPTRPSSPSKDTFPNEGCLRAVNFDDYGLVGQTQGINSWEEVMNPTVVSPQS